MAKLLALPDYNKKILTELTEYTKTSPYKSGLRLLDPEYKGIKETYNTIKDEAKELEAKKSDPTKDSDRINYAFAFSVQRDFITRYASRKALMKAAIDRKMFYNSMIANKINHLKALGR